MPNFSIRSKERLATCDKRLQTLFNIVVIRFDCTILEGRRGKVKQDEMFSTGKSQLEYPDSKHNAEAPELSKAIDVAPYPIDWNDREQFTLFAGYVIAKAEDLGIPIRWGGDWNGNLQVKDNNFDDLPHFELVD